MKTVFLVKTIWSDGCDVNEWVEGVYASEEKAIISIDKLKAENRRNEDWNYSYEVDEWLVE